MLPAYFVCAQQTKQFSFRHFSTTDGLAANNVRSTVQDKEGFIWIATSDGLQRFDGTRFITFRHSSTNPASISSNDILQLLVDQQERLWVLFVNGRTGIFDTRQLQFKEVPVIITDKKNLGADKELCHGLNGTLIYLLKGIATLIYNNQTSQFAAAGPLLPVPAGWKIHSITADAVTKRYWIGADSGIAVYNPATKGLSYAGHLKEKEPLLEKWGTQSYVYHIFIDAQRRFWFERWPPSSGNAVLNCINLRTYEALLSNYSLTSKLNQYHELRSLLEQKDGSLWIRGAQVFGQFNEAKKDFTLVYNGFINDQSIAYDVVMNLFEDREQNIWVSTSDNGLFLFNPSNQLFTVVKHMDWLRNTVGIGAVMSFARASNGTILTGAWSNGLFRYDSTFDDVPLQVDGIAEKNYRSVWSMCLSKDNHTIWMAMQPGVARYDQATNKAILYNPSILENRTVRQVLEDRQGNLWLGVQNRGIYKWIRAKAAGSFEQGFIKIPSIPSTNINKIIEDSKGFIWICTHIDGIYKIDPLTDSVVDRIRGTGPAAKKLLDNLCTTVLEYNDSLMLIGAGGLNIYNTTAQTVKHVTVEDGLPSDLISSMEKDRRGIVWMGMQNGLCRFDLAKKKWAYYNRKDGLINDNFIMAASYSMPDGRMLFGTNENFVVFDPLRVNGSYQPPDVRITAVKLADKSLPPDSVLRLQRLELPYDQNSLQIQFAGLTYRNKDKISYYYMLEGLDREWKKADGLNQVFYSYLPASTYQFKVKMETGDGVESRHITTIKIKIKPLFWRTWWFVSLLVFAAISLFLYADWLRRQRIRATMRMRNKIASNFTKDMSSTLGTINVLSEMAKVKADTDPSRTKEYVKQISDNSSRMMEVMGDMIWSIKPDNDNLEHVVEKMNHFAAELHAKYGVEIHFKLGENVREIKLRMDQRHELYALSKEALTNAARHSQTRYIDVGVDYYKSKLRLRIQDEGKGFDVEAVSFGRGLNDMQNKASSLQAKLTIQSEINTGTIVQLEMPL